MNRIKMLTILSLLLAWAVLPLVPARAVGLWEKYTEWYADATMEEVVCWRFQHCDGTFEAEGYSTSYRQTWLLEECSADGGDVYNACRYVSDPHWHCPAYCSFCY